MRTASFDTFNSEPEPVTLTFGKHRGKPLADVEASYLEWVLTADRITPDLKAAIDIELASRAPVVAIRDRWKCPSPVSANTRNLAELIITVGERELADAFYWDMDFQRAVEALRTYVANIHTDDGDLAF